jgi:L-ascorbate metabolism protein UlaG (beta-lactamase superfamily)
MKGYLVALAFIIQSLSTMVSAQSNTDNGINFIPIRHATMVIQVSKQTIYVDPVGDTNSFAKFPRPDFILITDIHKDHLDKTVVGALKQKKTIVIAPKAVTDQLKYGVTLKNGDKKAFGKIHIEVIPMYNLTAERLQFHEKGRGNGYVITANKKRIYISGDTEDIKEMRALKNIDYAFICMNLPFTMTEEQAASAVLEMKPKVVYPFHYKGKEGMSDVDKFKRLVGKDKNIEVRQLNWYP